MPTLADYLALTDGEVRQVRLTRLTDPRPTIVYEGPARFGIHPLPPYNRGRIRRPAGHLSVTVTPLNDPSLSWAEATTFDDYHDGALVVEDYDLELADVDPLPTATDQAADALVQETEMANHLAASFAGLTDAIDVGGTTIPVPPAPPATLTGYGDTVSVGDRVRIYWGERYGDPGAVMADDAVIVAIDEGRNHCALEGASFFALRGTGFRRRFVLLEGASDREGD